MAKGAVNVPQPMLLSPNEHTQSSVRTLRDLGSETFFDLSRRGFPSICPHLLLRQRRLGEEVLPPDNIV